jgi:hypothetical protein
MLPAPYRRRPHLASAERAPPARASHGHRVRAAWQTEPPMRRVPDYGHVPFAAAWPLPFSA